MVLTKLAIVLFLRTRRGNPGPGGIATAAEYKRSLKPAALISDYVDSVPLGIEFDALIEVFRNILYQVFSGVLIPEASQAVATLPGIVAVEPCIHALVALNPKIKRNPYEMFHGDFSDHLPEPNALQFLHSNIIVATFRSPIAPGVSSAISFRAQRHDSLSLRRPPFAHRTHAFSRFELHRHAA